MLNQFSSHHRRLSIALSAALALALIYGLHPSGLFAQTQGSYEAGVEGQTWQQLPAFGRGIDAGNERPITTALLVPPPTIHNGIADVWPCTTTSDGFPSLCYPSGTIGVEPPTAVAPDTAQNYGGRFAPCLGNLCYASGLIGIGPATTWANGPCVMRDGGSGTDCYPSGIVPGTPDPANPGGFLDAGPRVPPANGQLAGPIGIAVDNTANVGTIYVADHWNHRVQAFLFDGSVVSLTHPIGDGVAGIGAFTPVVGDPTMLGERLSFPESIKVDANRNILVADAGNGRIAVFDQHGALIDSLTVNDPNPIPDPTPDDPNHTIPMPAYPSGIALSPGASFRGANNQPDDVLVVTDKANCTVFIFNATTLQQVGLAGGNQCLDTGDQQQFSDVSAVDGASVDSDGHVYAADYYRDRVEIFDRTGAFVTAFGDPLAGAVAPFAMHGPTDVMVDHRGVYTETDDQNVTHRVSRVWVVDSTNQRLAAYKINFDGAVPVATFLFELNAAGDLNGFPTKIAEDTSRDPVGKLVTTDPGNARVQRFQVPDLAIVNAIGDPSMRTVTFDVYVPAGKDIVGVSTVTPIVCPTSPNTTVSSGTAFGTAGCRSLTPIAHMAPGDHASLSVDFVTGQNSSTFDIYATGNPDINNVPQTTSNVASVAATSSCLSCTLSAEVLAGGTLESLVPPVSPSTLYVGARIYTTQVAVRISANSTIGLDRIFFKFISGPELANISNSGSQGIAQNGAQSGSFDVPFRLAGTSILEFWATNTDGTEIAHRMVQLTLDLTPPTVTFRFDRMFSASGSHPNDPAGWWNKPASLPMDFTGQLTAVTPLGATMDPNPPVLSPLQFTTEGRNLGFSVTVSDTFGLTATVKSNDAANDGQAVNIDMTPPVFVASPAIVLERTSYLGAPPPANAQALATDPALHDLSAGSGVKTVVPTTTVVNFPMGTNSVSFTATDVAGNASDGSVNVTVQDTIAPFLSCPATLDMQAGLLGTVFAQPGFSVTDASMIGAPANTTPVVVTQSPAVGFSLPFLTVLNVTLTATDPSGNTTTCPTKVTGKLLGPPHFTSVPPAQTIEAGATPNLTATAVDSAGTTLTVTNNRPATFPLGLTIVTFSATDLAGQTVTATTNITVSDTTKPVIAAHGNVSAEATSASGAVPNYTLPQVTDNFDAASVATCAPAPTATFPFGATTVTCNATDSSGNIATATTFTVTVADTTRPVIAAHTDVTAEATSAGTTTVTYASPATSDAVDGPQTASCTPASGTAFAFGNTTVTCRATDAHGNIAAPTTFVVHVVDTTAPVIAAHADITVPTAGVNGAAVSYTVPTAADAVDGTKNATCTPGSGATFPNGNTTVTCRITDAHGNVATPTTFVVHVVDTTPPVLTLPASMTIEATSAAGAVRTFTATATDNVNGALTPTCAPPSGSTFPLGTTTVACSVTDAAGNTASGSFTITVRDTTAPTVTVPANMTVPSSGGTTTTVTFTSSASDLVSGSLPTTCTPASGSGFPVGPTTVTCTAADAAGNTGSASFTVTVGKDTTKPVVTVPANMTVEATSASGALVTFTATATDNGGPLTPVCTPASGSTFPLGTTTVTCTATDASGNKGTASFTVTVKDTTPPVITVPANITASATSANGAAVTFSPAPSATDAVTSNLTVICVPFSGTTFPIGTTTVTCGTIDRAGNIGTKSFTVTVVDNQPPVITSCPAAVTIYTTAGTPTALPNLTGGVTATDFSAFTVTQSPAAGTMYTLSANQSSLAVPVTLTVTDASPAHNVATCATPTVVTFAKASTPVCTAAVASPSVLWPPNHKFAAISINGITNADGSKVTTAVSSVFQDEPTQGLGDGDTPIDAVISNGAAQVRAERAGTGDGRVYYLKFTATTANGGSCTGTVTVSVPHDQAHAAVGNGALYDSTKASTGGGDDCHGEGGHGHHDGDGCINGHHGHYDGDECDGRSGYHHDGDGHGGGRDGGSHRGR